MPVARAEVLRLYKNLLSYSKTLTFTDVGYYKKRICNEFRRNRTLSDPEDIVHAFKKGEALLKRGSIV